jgi:secreted PhoX family phosphatase
MRRRALLASVLGVPVSAASQTPRLPPPTPAAPSSPAAPGGPPGTAAIPLDDRVAQGWRRDVLIRWGDRVLPGAPSWDPSRPDPAAAAAQFGWDALIVALIEPPPVANGARRAILAVAHPTLDPAMAMPAGQATYELAGAMQGASIVNLEFQGAGRAARWVVVEGGFQSRRITTGTLCRISGPLVGDPALRTTAEPAADSVRGLIAPQGGCATPWGSVLFAEGDPAQRAPWAATHLADPGIANRFGWIVEADPRDPITLPVKRTAAGRRAHGDVAATRSGDGRAVLYISEAVPGGFLYRFVSSATIATGEDADNAHLLDDGALFVARRAGDRGTWVRLPETNAARLDPRAAAQQVGATPLDHPSGLALAADQRLFVALRGDPMAGPDRAGGRIIELSPAGNDALAEGFAFATLASVPAGLRVPGVEAVFASPDTLELDGQARLWVGTAQGALQAQSGAPDGLFVMPIDGSARGSPRRVYAAPRGASVGGAAFPAGGGPGAETAVLAAVRRPGYERGATFAAPVTRWPAFDPALPPRTTLIALANG